MADSLYISFLWHMHQPYYKDPLKGEYALPWVYLHAIKDYYDMAAIVDETKGARVVFNLVPSLLEQIGDYARGEAVDPFLIRGMMPAVEMKEEDRLFVLDNFFSANRQRMIDPYPRYLELLHLKGAESKATSKERLRQFSNQDILDLQVWFFLAWTGEAVRRRFPEVRQLIQKGRNFSEGDKAGLFALHREVLAGLIPLYKKLHDEGKAELSVTPYYHPILPLLCEMKIALTAMPKANLPAAKFRHPEDARNQVERGVAYFEDIFGFRPAGMWPSEGSVSDEALNIISGCGLKWVATDEDIIARTLSGNLGAGKCELYHPYTFHHGAREVRMFFRDHQLSDLIGFTYSQWDSAKAAKDFVGRLNSIRETSHGARIVPVILDGENAWEYYENNGYDFLSGLYTAIDAAPRLKLATFSEVLDLIPSRRELTHIHPGSWISANYGIWVGHPEENQAWDYLERARETAVNNNPLVADMLASGDRHLTGDSKEHEKAAMVCHSIYAAEGSDWFWWYGDDHFSTHSDRFDRLFRKHLMNVYRLLNLDIPRELFEPIKKKTPAGMVRAPASFITPAINGYVDDYFEWLAAGLFDLTKQGSAMHAAESLLQSLFYGFDREFLYFRLDSFNAMEKVLRTGDRFHLHITTSQDYLLIIQPDADSTNLLVRDKKEWRETGTACSWKIGRICEARIPLEVLDLRPKAPISVYLTLERNGEEFGRWPADSFLSLAYAGSDLELDNWLI